MVLIERSPPDPFETLFQQTFPYCATQRYSTQGSGVQCSVAKNKVTGIKKLLPEKVTVLVLKIFGTGKSIGIGIKKIWYRKKSNKYRYRKYLVLEKKSIGIV